MSGFFPEFSFQFTFSVCSGTQVDIKLCVLLCQQSATDSEEEARFPPENSCLGDGGFLTY